MPRHSTNPIYEPTALHITVDIERCRYVLRKPHNMLVTYNGRPVRITIPAGTHVAGGPELVALRSNLALHFLSDIGASHLVSNGIARDVFNQDRKAALSTHGSTVPPPYTPWDPDADPDETTEPIVRLPKLPTIEDIEIDFDDE